MKKNNKSEIIKSIIKEGRYEGEKYFDTLNDKSEQHLNKLLTIIRNWK